MASSSFASAAAARFLLYSVSSAAGASKGFDMIVAAENFKTQIESYNTGLPCMFLKRLVDKKEIEEKLTPVLKEMGVLE